MYLINFYILNIKGADYHCSISGINKSEAINLMQDIDLTKKSETLLKPKNLSKLNFRSNFEAVKLITNSSLKEKSGKL